MPRRQFYPASISRDQNGLFRVILRDLPEIAASARTLDEAVDRAAESLEKTLAEHANRGDSVPGPTALRSNELLI